MGLDGRHCEEVSDIFCNITQQVRLHCPSGLFYSQSQCVCLFVCESSKKVFWSNRSYLTLLLKYLTPFLFSKMTVIHSCCSRILFHLHFAAGREKIERPGLCAEMAWIWHLRNSSVSLGLSTTDFIAKAEMVGHISGPALRSGYIDQRRSWNMTR